MINLEVCEEVGVLFVQYLDVVEKRACEVEVEEKKKIFRSVI